MRPGKGDRIWCELALMILPLSQAWSTHSALIATLPWPITQALASRQLAWSMAWQFMMVVAVRTHHLTQLNSWSSCWTTKEQHLQILLADNCDVDEHYELVHWHSLLLSSYEPLILWASPQPSSWVCSCYILYRYFVLTCKALVFLLFLRRF